MVSDVDGIATLNPFRYRSYYFDEETGLYYLQTRYYDPELGRFISADSIEYLDPQTVGGLNLYAYCGNNPVMFVDENGTKREWWEWLIAGLLIVGIFAAFAIATVVTGGAALAVGGLIGTTIGFGGSVISQGVLNGWNNIDPWQILLDTGLSAFSGMLGASGIGKVASFVCGTTLGAIGSIGSDMIAGNPINIEKAVIMATVCGIIGRITGAGATNSKELGKLLTNGIETSGKFSIASGVAKLLNSNTTKHTFSQNIDWVAIQHMAIAISSASLGIAASIWFGTLYDLGRKK